MPRKQRFKPSRKPKVVQETTGTKDDDVLIGDRQLPVRDGREPRPADHGDHETRAALRSTPLRNDVRRV